MERRREGEKDRKEKISVLYLEPLVRVIACSMGRTNTDALLLALLEHPAVNVRLPSCSYDVFSVRLIKQHVDLPSCVFLHSNKPVYK